MTKFKKDDIVTFTGEGKVTLIGGNGSIKEVRVGSEYYSKLPGLVTLQLKSRPFEAGKLYQDSAGSVWLRTVGLGMPRGAFWQNVTRAPFVVASINPDESTLQLMVPED